MNEEALRALSRLVRQQESSVRDAERVNSLLLEQRSSKELASVNAKELSADTYKKNRIYQLFLEHREQLSFLEWTSYRPFEPFVYQEAECDPKNLARTRMSVGYFSEEFPFPALLDKRDSTIWMSLIPHEMNTMERHLREMSGNVLVLGGGLLYFPLMTELNPNVKSITVVEIDNKILELNKKILRETASSHKISLVEGNGLEATRDTSGFNHVFADLWHMAEDGMPLYSSLLLNEEKNPGTVFHYWIEEEMIIYLRECLLVYLHEVAEGLPEKAPEAYEDYPGQPNSDAIVHAFQRMGIERKTNTKDQLLALISRDSIRKLAKEIRPNWEG